MGKRRCVLVMLLLLVGACTSRPQLEVPTRAVLPTIPPSAEPPTFAPTQTPQLISTAPAVSVTESSIPVLVGSINASSAAGIALRREPSANAEVVATIPGGTIAHARRRSSDNGWYEVITDDGSTGWLAARDLFAGQDLTALPALEVAAVPTQTPIPPPTLTQPPTAITLGDVPAMERRLRETPILANLISERVQAIFRLGQSLGNRANVFTTVGDSNTTNGDFLQPIGMNADAYCIWGDYNYLRDTVTYFSAPPSDDDSTSFTHHSIAAQKGFSSAAALDPFWSHSGICLSGESPVQCEYRTVQPSVAVIMLGGIDVTDLSTADYDANMRSIVHTLVEQSVIPVLTTFVVLPSRDVYEKSLEFNMTLLDIAAEQQLPLINLWAAAQSLPDDGIGPDHTHLKAVVGSFCSFDGAQQQYGGTLRNLLTLQALDQLRKGVLAL